jgi:hypothetical protein
VIADRARLLGLLRGVIRESRPDLQDRAGWLARFPKADIMAAVLSKFPEDKKLRDQLIDAWEEGVLGGQKGGSTSAATEGYDAEGKSIHATKLGQLGGPVAAASQGYDAEGKSIHAKRIGSAAAASQGYDAEGKSIHAKRIGKLGGPAVAASQGYDADGKSIHAKRIGLASAASQGYDAEGKSIHAKRMGQLGGQKGGPAASQGYDAEGKSIYSKRIGLISAVSPKGRHAKFQIGLKNRKDVRRCEIGMVGQVTLNNGSEVDLNACFRLAWNNSNCFAVIVSVNSVQEHYRILALLARDLRMHERKNCVGQYPIRLNVKDDLIYGKNANTLRDAGLKLSVISRDLGPKPCD